MKSRRHLDWSHRSVLTAGADQALSTGTNVLGTIGVARAASESEFAGFALFLLAYSFCVGLVNAAVCEPSIVSGRKGAREGGRTVGLAMVIAGGLGAASAGAFAVIADGDAREVALLPLALLPLLAAHEAVRVVNFCVGRVSVALLADGLWFVLAAAALLASVVAPTLVGPVEVALLWGLSGGVAAVVAIQNAGIGLPEIWAGWRVGRSPSNVRKAFVVDHLVMYTATYAAPYSAAAVGGISVLGAIRGAQVLFGPPQLLIAGARLLVVPMFAKREVDGTPFRTAVRLGVGLTVMVVSWAFTMYVVPDSMGVQLLGETWFSAMEFLPLLAGAVAGRAAATVPAAALRGLGDKRSVLIARAVDAPATVIGATTGAIVAGPIGAVAGWAAANLLAAVVWWRLLTRARAGVGDLASIHGPEGRAA